MNKVKKIIYIILPVVFVLTLLLIDIFYININYVTIREETIYSSKITNKEEDTIIAYFSDAYIDNGNQLIKGIDIINSVNPDIVLFGGDLFKIIDDVNINETIELLKTIKAKKGKYAILGDNDLDNMVNIENIFISSNFKILNNETYNIYFDSNDYISISSIANCVNDIPDINQTYSNINNNHFNITISHTPDNFDLVDISYVDLFLSGHSLGQEIYLPLFSNINTTLGANKYYHGNKLINNVILDISDGLGTTKKARLFTNCEVVLYKLKAK